VRTRAPAKINWTLEVLGKREDGYHEIRSVMQTIDLCDDVVVEEGGRRKKEAGWIRAGSSCLAVEGEHAGRNDDLTLSAVSALEKATGRDLPVAISLVKGVPVASGLGGGSSDAAAVLRCVNRLYGLGLSTDEMATIGASIGSDVPFFAYGGTAWVKGRGERVTPLPDVATAWLALVVPRIKLPDKTKRMYEAISVEDFSDGSSGETESQRLRAGKAVREENLYNAFERAAYTKFEGLSAYRDALMSAGAEAAHLAGAGPAIFALAASEAAARGLAERVQALGAKVLVARTLTAPEATVTD
jgi:4-diphosphocytidyl-2-C-methyl-D-erythritol kinase